MKRWIVARTRALQWLERRMPALCSLGRRLACRTQAEHHMVTAAYKLPEANTMVRPKGRPAMRKPAQNWLADCTVLMRTKSVMRRPVGPQRQRRLEARFDWLPAV